MEAKSLLIRNIRPWGGETTDLLVSDGKIAKISANQKPPAGCETYEGDGAIMLPGLVEAHTHLDKTLWGMGWRPHQAGPALRDKIETERRLRREWAIEPHRQSMRQALLSISHGTTGAPADRDAGLARTVREHHGDAAVLGSERITAPAVTGPAKGPLPASSMPAIRAYVPASSISRCKSGRRLGS